MVNIEDLEISEDDISICLDNIDSFLGVKNANIDFESERVSTDDQEITSFLKSINYFLENISQIENSIKKESFRYYVNNVMPKKDEYEKVFDISLGSIESESDMNALIKLNCIYVDLNRPASESLGFNCSCVWDKEHGLGLKMKGQNQFAIGGADVSFPN